MSGLSMPPAQPPGEEVQRLLEELRLARAELEHACHVMRLLEVERPAAMVTVHGRRRQQIEVDVAELRASRWAQKVADLEELARAVGLTP